MRRFIVLSFAALFVFSLFSCQAGGGKSASSDASLSSLIVSFNGSPLALAPAFSAETYAYSATAAYNAGSVKVSAAAADGGARVSGTGAVSLALGANALSLVVTAEDGKTSLTYTIEVSRPEWHVYIDGGVWAAKGKYEYQQPVYWKDGLINYLPLNEGYLSGGLGGIAVSASGDIYVAGNQQGTLVGYWKNSAFHQLPAGSGYSSLTPSDIAIASNGDIWLVGYGKTTTSTDYVYWKNEEGPTPLTGSPANANVISADHAGNVYIVGTIGSGAAGKPYVWVNGGEPKALPIGDTYTNGNAHRIGMDSSGEFFACGQVWSATASVPAFWNTTAGVWQAPSPLSTAGLDPSSFSINMLDLAFASDDTPSFVALVRPASGALFTSLYRWAGASGAPAAMGSVNGATALLVTDSAAAFDGDDRIVVAGSAGTDQPNGRNTWPITDGVPISWTNGEPASLQTDASYPFGWARSIAVGP
jgi:hypothetical protein